MKYQKRAGRLIISSLQSSDEWDKVRQGIRKSATFEGKAGEWKLLKEGVTYCYENLKIED
jgi:hypothetical protein